MISNFRSIIILKHFSLSWVILQIKKKGTTWKLPELFSSIRHLIDASWHDEFWQFSGNPVPNKNLINKELTSTFLLDRWTGPKNSRLFSFQKDIFPRFHNQMIWKVSGTDQSVLMLVKRCFLCSFDIQNRNKIVLAFKQYKNCETKERRRTRFQCITETNIMSHTLAFLYSGVLCNRSIDCLLTHWSHVLALMFLAYNHRYQSSLFLNLVWHFPIVS